MLNWLKSSEPHRSVHSQVTIGDYQVLISGDGLPDIYDHYKERATLCEEIELDSFSGDSVCFIGVRKVSHRDPDLVVAQSYSPAGFSFYPGILIVPETRNVFIGAGERILAYRLEPPERLWEDAADTGFLRWQRHGDFVVLSAELELAAWTIHGEKLWTTFVEPPWDYSVEGTDIRLDVMGHIRTFPLSTGLD